MCRRSHSGSRGAVVEASCVRQILENPMSTSRVGSLSYPGAALSMSLVMAPLLDRLHSGWLLRQSSSQCRTRPKASGESVEEGNTNLDPSADLWGKRDFAPPLPSVRSSLNVANEAVAELPGGSSSLKGFDNDAQLSSHSAQEVAENDTTGTSLPLSPKAVDWLHSTMTLWSSPACERLFSRLTCVHRWQPAASTESVNICFVLLLWKNFSPVQSGSPGGLGRQSFLGVVRAREQRAHRRLGSMS